MFDHHPVKQAASCGRALRDGSEGEQEAEMSIAQGEEIGERLLSWVFEWLQVLYMGVNPTIGGFYPKMDGENHGKPYENG